MRIVDDILQKIEYCIINGQYLKLENEKIELKDNSHTSSEWNEVFKTVNAFLNTEGGGILVIGVKEDEKNARYVFTGFDFKNEPKIKSIVTESIFLDDNNNRKNVAEYIRYVTVPFQQGQVLVIYVDALPDDERFVLYNGFAYERIITGDHKIGPEKMQSQKEYKADLINPRELRIVKDATLADLDHHRLNDYIQLLNSEVKMENIKSSIVDGISFLARNVMIRDNIPTILGMLVCGKDPGEKLHWASQVDAYVDVPGSDSIAQNKKIINGTVIQLMQQSIAFVNSNIQTGISVENAGTKTFEYPERLIRECVNNSLAHRDYSINQFININIVPGRHLQIKNPGRFKAQLIINDLEHSVPIRRIVSGNPKANNPKLAKVLSVYSRWEGKGYGMATVVGACLEDKIDVPYYIFHSADELSLFIPKGKLVDENMESLFDSYSGYISKKLDGFDITEEQKRILTYYYKSELLNKLDRYTILLTKDNNHLQAIQSLQDAGLVYRHPVSNEIYSVFILDRNLFQKSFTKELTTLFGNIYTELEPDYKEVLSFIFERNNYSKNKFPSANEIGNKLWVKKGNVNKLEGFEVYKRKVRNIVNKLEKSGFLLRNKHKPEYFINVHYGVNDLFNE
jgi:predicted HTH transcriptional regulator